MNDVKVEVYGQPDCPYCDRAKLYLDHLKIGYAYYDLAQEPDRRKEMVARGKLTGLITVPQIFVQGTHVGGCDDLMVLPVDVLQQMVGGA